MAVSAGSLILASDIKSWYSDINAVLSAAGQTQISPPKTLDEGTKAEKGDVNNIINAVNNTLRTNGILKTHGWTDQLQTVNTGDLIQATLGSLLQSTDTVAKEFKCYKQSNSNGWSQGAHGNGWSQGTHGNGYNRIHWDTNACAHWSPDSQYGNWWNQGVHWNAWSQGANSNGRYTDTRNNRN